MTDKQKKSVAAFMCITFIACASYAFLFQGMETTLDHRTLFLVCYITAVAIVIGVINAD